MAGDSNFGSVSLLLPFDGPNGGTTFLDRSNTPKTVTVNGNAQLSTAQSKFGGASLLLDGSGDFLSLPSAADLNFGLGDFSVEAWINPSNVSGRKAILGGGSGEFMFGLDNDQIELGKYFVSGVVESSFGVIPANQWTHVAVVRQAGVSSLYVNGVFSASATDANNYSFASGSRVGATAYSTDFAYFNGHIDDLRITKGVARYTATFTPPTEPNPIGYVTVIDPSYSSVSLLINADGSTLVDESPSPKALTAFGNAALSKVNSRVGAGSLLFDGTGDYIEIADNPGFAFGTGDFTLECWYCPLSVSGVADYRGLICQRTNANSNHAFSLFVNQNNLGFGFAFTLDGYTNNEQHFGSALTVNTWYHVAVSRVGVNLYFSVNGTVTTAAGSASALFDSSVAAQLGRLDTYAGGDLHGYLDSVRVTKGTARYLANFTPPGYVLSNVLAYENLTLSIPTRFNLYEDYSINIPTQFDVKDLLTLSIPTQFNLYEDYSINIPTQFNIGEYLTLSIPTQFNLYQSYPVSIPTQFNVNEVVIGGGEEINGGEINGEGGGSYTITRLTIPTLFQLKDTVQLFIPTAFTIVSFPNSILIPTAFINYQVFLLSIPTQLVVQPPSLRLSVPTQFKMHESHVLSVPTRFQVFPGNSSGTGSQGVGTVVFLPSSRSQEWSLQVLMNGVDVSNRLVGSISIDEEESSATVAVFSLRLPDGIVDPYEWVKASVELSYEDVSNGVAHLLFKGIVDTPAHNATSRITEFTCTDNLQNDIRAMSHEQVDALTPLSEWSDFVFDEQVDSWDYLQDRLATYPYAIYKDLNGQLVTYNFQASTILYEFGNSVILDGSLSTSLANAREIINQVNVSLDAQFELFRETMAKIRWEGEIAIPMGMGAAIVWPCSANMPVDAIQGAGATFVDDPLFGVQAGNRTVHGVNILNPGTELLVEAFQGLASKRYMQPVTHSSTWSVQSTDSIAQLGVVQEDLSTAINVEYNGGLEESFNRVLVKDMWLCSASSFLQSPRLTPTSYLPGDPLLPVTNGTLSGMVTYPLLPIQYEVWDPDAIPNLESRAYHLNGSTRVNGRPHFGEVLYDFDDFVVSGTSAERTRAENTLIAQAKVKVLSTHRQNRAGFTTFINPLLKRGQTLRINTSTVVASGVVYQLQHTFDIDQGTALTNVTLAVSSSKVIGLLDTIYSDIRLKIPTKFEVFDGSTNSDLPMDNSTINYNQVLLQHVNDDPEDFTYNNQHWGGFFTSYTSVKYQEFIVEWPDLPEVNTANATAVSNGGIINVDVPNDEFYLIA